MKIISPLMVLLMLTACMRPEPEAVTSPALTRPLIGFDSGFAPLTQVAEVDESVIQTVLHVQADAVNGNGSEAAPFSSIMAAQPHLIALLETGTPVKLQIGPGTYREDLSGFLRLRELSPVVHNTTLIIEGCPQGGTVISGAIPFDAEWKPMDEDRTLWVADWPYQWEPDPGPWVATFGHPEIRDETARREALVIDGEMMRLRAIEKWSWHQPGGAPGAEAGGRPLGEVPPGHMRFEGLVTESVSNFLSDPGDFTVVTHPDTPEHLRGRIFLRRDPGEGPPEQVEIPLVRHANWPLMRIAYKDNLVLRNLTFTHANSGYLSSALIVANANNVLVEDCRFIDNVNGGLVIRRSERVTLRRVYASHNGQKGIGVGSTRNLLLEDCETSYNNIRGHWTNFRRWDPAGIKLGDVHQVHFLRHTAIGNYGGGIWWDVYCTDMLVDRSLMYGNGRLGVEMELAAPNGGNWEMRNSISAWNTGAGVFVSMAANTRLLNNVLAHNGGGELEAEISRGQIVFKVRRHPLKGPQSADEWESVTVRDNLFFADDDQHFITFLRRNIDPAEQIPYVLDVLDSGNNHYLSRTLDAGFSRVEGGYGDFAHWLGLLSARRPMMEHETGSIRELAAPPDLAHWAHKLGTPWDSDKINAWHQLREQGHFALEHFGL